MNGRSRPYAVDYLWCYTYCMGAFRQLSVFFLMLLLLALAQPATASHIKGGEIYWECISSGPDAGKMIFYLKVYRDCTIPLQTIVAPQLSVSGSVWNTSIALSLVSETDISPAECGSSCNSQNPTITSVSQYLFASEPVAMIGIPPASGIRITYGDCCRSDLNNYVSASAQNIRLVAIMYPYEGRDLYPCYDSSPQFAEAPISVYCAGSEMRYQGAAHDQDADSLSYVFNPMFGSGTETMAFQSGYSMDAQLPGPAVNPSYSLASLDGQTGMLSYDGAQGLVGQWGVGMHVLAWRCGRLLSRNYRDLMVTYVPCSEANNTPSISAPVWQSPASASGFEVSVLAGELVRFDLSAFDVPIGAVQSLSFSAEGAQFGEGFVDENAGCLGLPCATLSNVVPPAIVTDTSTMTTTFNWQTSCEHVLRTTDCAKPSATYHFQFRFEDGFCPVHAVNSVNVAVTVIGEAIVRSPKVHCVKVEENGDISLVWEAVSDTNAIPSFAAYVVEHSLALNGPFMEIGSVTDIEIGEFLHSSDNSIAAPSLSSANYYRVRSMSGCDDSALDAAYQTVSSIHLTLVNAVTTAQLSWTRLSNPLPASASANYLIYREYPAGTWELIDSTASLSYADPVVWSGEQVNYRVELEDGLPCVSRSNVVGDMLNDADYSEVLKGISVAPNPSNGSFDVIASIAVRAYELMDVSGRMLMQAEANPTERLRIETGLPVGTYLLRLDTEKGNVVRKVVVGL